MNVMDRLREFIAEHRYTVLCAVAGLILGILILTINLWRTLLLCALVGACVVIGRLLDQGGWDAVRAFFDRILPRR